MWSVLIDYCRDEEKGYSDQALDRISQLPDDIIVNILSSIDMKDAARTSILSTRWRYLSTELADLDFDTFDVIIVRGNYFLDNQMPKPKYLNWVNQVVSNHNGPQINKFKVFNLFDRVDGSDIATWVKFALSKRVKELFLGVQVLGFPTHTFSLGFDILKNSACDSGISYLTSLDLNHVGIRGEFIEFLLSRCRFLERLGVTGSDDLLSFKVLNSAHSLKHLSVRKCRNFKQLEIDSPGLMSFEYQDVGLITRIPPDISFSSVPLLVEAAFGGSCCITPFLIFPQIACLAKQLSKLTIYLQSLYFDRDPIPMQVLPSFSNVKHLFLIATCDCIYAIWKVRPFVEACPGLHDLTLQIDLWFHDELPHRSFKLQRVFVNSDCDGDTEEDEDASESVLEVENSDDEESNDELQYENIQELEPEHNITYPNLKRIVLNGFRGSMDVDLVLHISDHAPALETLEIVIRKPVDIPNEDPNEDPNEEALEDLVKVYRRRAYKFARILPPAVEIHITLSDFWGSRLKS